MLLFISSSRVNVRKSHCVRCWLLKGSESYLIFYSHFVLLSPVSTVVTVSKFHINKHLLLAILQVLLKHNTIHKNVRYFSNISLAKSLQT